MSEMYMRQRGQADLIRSIPLAYNDFFQIRIALLSKIKEADILCIEDLFDEDDPIYGVGINDKLYELHSNNSNIGTIVSTPHNLKEWDCDKHLQIVATWGALRNQRNPPPIIGYSSRSYSQDER
eukprot:6211316-Pleurochrysis_carterae.AAC.5